MPKISTSNIQGYSPKINQLPLGDVFINTYDGKVFIKKTTNKEQSIVDLTKITSSFAISSSYALTASYLDNYIPSFPYTGSALITGSLGITGSFSTTDNVFLKGIINQTTPVSHVVTFDNTTGRLYITASSAFGGGGSGGSTPGGNNDTIQFNNAGVLDGSDNFKLVGGNAVYLTGSLILSSSYINEIQYVTFDTNATQTPALAQLNWNQTDKTLEFGSGDGNTTIQIGQETYYPPIVNKDSIDLIEGTLVMIDPTDVAQGNRIRVIRAITNGTYPAQYLVGVLTEDIARNQEGFATWFGYVRNIDITTIQPTGSGGSWVEGDVLFADPDTPGGLTKVRPPAPAIDATIAVITAINGNNLTLLVRPTLTFTMDELNDVSDPSSVNGDLLVKSGSVWVAGKQLTGSYSLTGSLISTIGFTGSLLGTASNAVSASYAVSSSFSRNSLLLNNTASSVFATTSSNIFKGSQTISGSFYSTGSFNVKSDSLNLLGTTNIILNAGTILAPLLPSSSAPGGITLNTVLVDTSNGTLYVTSSLPGTGSAVGVFDRILTGSITASVTDGTNLSNPNFFLLQSGSNQMLKFNNERVMVLESRTITPTAVTGSIMYSSSGDFFLGI